MNRPAVVVGLESNGLGLVRSLGRAGVPVLGVTSDPKLPTARSRYCEVLPGPDERTDAIVERLLEIGRDQAERVPLFCSMEKTVALVSAARERLSEYFLLSLPPHDLLQRLNDKREFAHLAAERGILVPHTETVDSLDALEAAAQRAGFPLIVKPLEKGGGFDAHFKARALRLEDAADLRARFRGFPWGQALLVQQFIGGADSEIYFCLTYFGTDGEPLGHFTGRKIRIWPRVFGNTASACPAEVPEVTAATLDLFRDVGFRGLGSLEFKREAGTGRYYAIEPTLGRTDYQSEVAPANGVNLPYLAYCDLLGLPLPQPRPPPAPVTWIDPLSDARAAESAIASGELDQAAYRASVAGPRVYTLFARDDLRPYLIARYKAVLMRVKVALLGLLDTFPWLYTYFVKAIPPDLRWPPDEIKDSLMRHELPRKSFVDYFTRDPERRVPPEPRIIVSPADGVVRKVFERDGRQVIDISMNFYDIHVQRVPLGGRVRSVEESGRRVDRDTDDERRYFADPWEYESDYLFPVQKVVRIDTEIGEVVVRQISSIWARRIETFVKPGEEVVAGQRLGHIFLGSTVVLELPMAARVVVESQLNGQPRKRHHKPIEGGETIVARF